MIFKWALVMFAVATIALLVLSKILALLSPPRPGRLPSPMRASVDRALRWSVLVPAALALLLLGIAVLGGR